MPEDLLLVLEDRRKVSDEHSFQCNAIWGQFHWKDAVSKMGPIGDRGMRLRKSLYEVCGFPDVETSFFRIYQHEDDIMSAKLELQF